MKEIQKLIDGFNRFRTRYYGNERAAFRRLVDEGQSPKIMVIACCDSRVDPAIITDCDPGDLFVVRNVANLVPPHESGGHYHGTSAALEFAIRFLKVHHVIVLGHARCGGIRTLVHGLPNDNDAMGQFIRPWMQIAETARAEAQSLLPNAAPDALERTCEQIAIRVSLSNLLTFPWIRQAVSDGELFLHGWYFDMDRGDLLRYDSIRKEYASLR